jgi:Fn3 domain-containing protein
MRDLLNGPFSTNGLVQLIERFPPDLAFAVPRDYLLGRIPQIWSELPEPVPSPVFNQNGGEIVPGFQLTITNPAESGVIYYTTNGVDPRAPGGMPRGILYEGPVELRSTRHVMARVLRENTWSALTQATFNVSSDASGMRITEIMYLPLDYREADDGHNFEFLELKNFAMHPVDLSRAFLTGIDYTFAPGTIVGPGAYMVLIKNPAYFPLRFPGVAYHGVYWGGLSTSGERIRLRNSDSRTLFTVQYDDVPPWPNIAIGAGHSLVLTNWQGDPNNPANWRFSTLLHGSPGREDSEFDFRLTLEPGPTAAFHWNSIPGLQYRVQYSTDLVTWNDIPPPITATAASTSFSEPRRPTSSFYRVVLDTFP